MPWWWGRRRRYYRRYWRRPRAPFRRRYFRRRWVRRRRPFKKRKISLQQFQPKCIRNCKIKGPCCLFQTTRDRVSNDFDLYQYSEVPEQLPGGGGWGIKVFSLDALFSDHEYARNVWTRDNHDLPLCRYRGCKLTFYQSDYADYICTYTNQLPMTSSLGMYNAMQPSIHQLQQNKIIMPSLNTYKKRKPYKKVFIPPPAPLQNKWYFTADLAKYPLLMLRTSSTSLNKHFIDPDTISNNITITSLNANIFQNRNFANPDQGTRPGYWAYESGGKRTYLYATRDAVPTNTPKAGDLIPLLDTLNYTPGHSFNELYHTGTSWNGYTTGYKNNMGNPFYSEYLLGEVPLYQGVKHITEIMTEYTNPQTPVQGLSRVDFTKKIRYNPEADQTHDHMVYFKCNKKPETGWKEPESEELTNEGLPYWLLLWGFADWHRKIKKHQHLDTDYIMCIRQHINLITRDYVIPLSKSFLNGRSPYYTDTPPRSEIDSKTWYPQLQYQVEAINEICLTGPGVPRIPTNYSVQGLVRYCFYFKWGGNLPPMSTIENPRQLPTFNLPGNQFATNSLQNPTTDPESLLYSFDERRHTLTKRAIKRLQKYQTTKKTLVADGSPFADQPQTTQTQDTESSSEEETETLFEQLQQQRRKQQQLRQRILLTLQQLQKLE
nr:MAG: ORF1 [TTV-like mini virus]